MKTNVCLIGHLGGNETFLDGQTIKTRSLQRGLREYGAQQIRLYQVDTYYSRKNKLKFLAQLTYGILTCRKILLCVSKGGRKIFFPMMYWLSRLLGKQVYHCAIGGRLADEVQEKPKWKVYSKIFRYHWVESPRIVEQLQALGVTNARFLPNFKELPKLRTEELRTSAGEPLRFCIFSRICREKGVTDAIRALQTLNEKRGRSAAKLDIYGQVEENYREEFFALLEASDDVVYCGKVAPEDSVEVLRDYDALLFPSYWIGEGIPGTIIDALCAGVPVIARRWRYCDEMLEDGVTGYCYDFEQPELLLNCMERAAEQPQALQDMRKNCLNAADRFRAENVVPELIRQILGN